MKKKFSFKRGCFVFLSEHEVNVLLKSLKVALGSSDSPDEHVNVILNLMSELRVSLNDLKSRPSPRSSFELR